MLFWSCSTNVVLEYINKDDICDISDSVEKVSSLNRQQDATLTPTNYITNYFCQKCFLIHHLVKKNCSSMLKLCLNKKNHNYLHSLERFFSS